MKSYTPPVPYVERTLPIYGPRGEILRLVEDPEKRPPQLATVG